MNAIYRVEVFHLRNSPLRYEVRSSSYQWFVDLDELPRLGPLARFDPADHLGDPGRSIRENVESYLREHGVDTQLGKITMLANARSLGYVFNPLTLFWCHGADGELECVIAEVHNTYGERHCYLLRTDIAGRAEVEKAFYVSPFYPVDGFYRMRVPEPGENLSITITLHRTGERPFVASVRGTRRQGGVSGAVRAAASNPLATWAVRAAIARHGIALYLKGLPVQPRPTRGCSQEVTVHARQGFFARGVFVRQGAADRLAGLLRERAGIELPVRVRAWDGSEAGPADGPVLVIKSRRALRRLAWSPGELGLARAYVSGELDVEGDLADGFRRAWRAADARPAGRVPPGIAGRARAVSTAIRLGAIGTAPKPPASEARLAGQLHSRSRDRAAIAHHYDLSNDFYQLLLDGSMAYSSAYYPGASTDARIGPITGAQDLQDLAAAQTAKLDLICRKLGLEPGMRHLDVGCGWGSLILHAAEHYGVRAIGVTLSERQRDLVAKRIADRGLADRVTVRLQDYREIADAEPFDTVSSIEMGEHVGESQYPAFASILFSHLRPSGRLLLQQMSRRAQNAPGGGAFIESYIAPDMYMRPMSSTVAFLENAGFEIRDVEAMREHYVRTVNAWLQTFEARYDKFVALVGDEVARVWRLYLVGGGLSFEAGRMGVDQILSVRPDDAGLSRMPHRRPWVLPEP